MNGVRQTGSVIDMIKAIDADDGEEEVEKLEEQREYLKEQRSKGRDGKLAKSLMGAAKHYAGADGTAYVGFVWDGEQAELEKEDMIRVWEGSLTPDQKERYDLILKISLDDPFISYDLLEDRVRGQLREYLSNMPHPEYVRG